MVTYTVKYKFQGWSSWKTIANVAEDGFSDYGVSRYFILANNHRLEVPSNALFQFDSRRQDRIEEIRASAQVQGVVDRTGLSVPGIAHPTLGDYNESSGN